MSNKSEEFAAKFGNELFEQIFSVFYGDETSDTITIDARQMVNACNHNFAGTFTVGDEEWSFVARDGNNDGSVIEDFSQELLSLSNEVTLRTFSVVYPRHSTETQKKRIDIQFALLIETELWQKQIRSMNYDYMFSPTEVIDQHYKKWAREHGVEITFHTITTD